MQYWLDFSPKIIIFIEFPCIILVFIIILTLQVGIKYLKNEYVQGMPVEYDESA